MINGFSSSEYRGDIRIKADHQLVLSNLARKAVRFCLIVVERILTLHIIFYANIRFKEFGIFHSVRCFLHAGLRSSDYYVNCIVGAVKRFELCRVRVSLHVRILELNLE